jgi:hypothetical protein
VNTAEDRPRRPDGGRFAFARAPRPNEGGDPSGYASPPPWVGGGFDAGGGGGRPFKNKGSRRGLRARKRSLSF